MADLSTQLADAEARVEQLKRQIKAGTCAETGHDWQSYGGRNASCGWAGKDCSCSVPVNFCTKCGDCDYGDNAEAARVIGECASERLMTGEPA